MKYKWSQPKFCTKLIKETLKSIFINVRNKIRILLIPLSVNFVPEIPSKKFNKIESIMRNQEIKLFCTDMYMKN